MQKLSILSRSLSKIKHKRYELYVLSRIVHLLNDPGIKYNFQQYAHRDGDKFALIDLYLPQFKIAIEVDEAYHKTQLTADEIRQREIETNIKIEHTIRIDCSKGIDEVNGEVDKCVSLIKEAREDAKKRGKYIEWDGLSGYEHYRQSGYLRLSDDQELSSPTEICNIFGILNAPQRGSVVWYNDNGDPYRIWWPRENCEEAGDWYNKMKDDDTIEEYCRKEEYTDKHGNEHKSPRKEHIDKVAAEDLDRIVFYARRNILNERLYRYVGVFQLDLEASYKDQKCVWKLNKDLSAEFKLPEWEMVEEDVALKSLNETLEILSELDEIKNQTDKWRTSFNENELDQIETNVKKAMKQLKTWCKSKTDVDLLKPHLMPLCAIKDDREQYDAYIRNEILPEWIRLQSLYKSDRKQKELKAKTKNKKK